MLTLTSGARLRLAAVERRYLQRLAGAGGPVRGGRRQSRPRIRLGLAQFLVDDQGKWKGFTLTMSADGQTVDFVRQPPAP